MNTAGPSATLWRGGPSLAAEAATAPTAAQRCLVRAATGPVKEIEVALAEWRSLVDLSGPIDGGSYRIIPVVFHRMQAAGLDDPLRGMLKGVYRLSFVESAKLLHAVTPVLHALGTAGLTVSLSKGAGLVGAGYYPTAATRPMSDVDIVINSAQREDAIRVLESFGYRSNQSARSMTANHAALFMNEARVEIDLHWHHLKHVRSTDADEIITRGSRVVDLNGTPVSVPGPAGLLIVSAIHGLVSNPEPPVRWLVDAAMILDRDGDRIAWDDVVEFATRFRFARRLEEALRLLKVTTGHAAPESTMAALAALPTGAVERWERRVATAPWNSRRAKLARLIAGYAGSDRELRHVATGFPRYLARIWNVQRLSKFPSIAGRKLVTWLGPGQQ